MEEKFQKIKEVVEKEISESSSSHDIDHVMRVYNLAMTIAKDNPKVDLEILQAATLLHDIGYKKESQDSTGQVDHAVVSAEMAKPILEKLDFSPEKIKHIQNCILSHRYRTENEPETVEAKILFDADKLESTGAIGIARAFAWIGEHGAKIYKKVDINEYINENLRGKMNGRIQDKSKQSVQIQYETKDKFLRDKLYTQKAKEIYQERISYYKSFLDRLEKEIKGEL